MPKRRREQPIRRLRPTLRSIAPGLAVAVAAVTAHAAGTPTPPGASFVDRFDRLETSQWQASHGWNNGSFQNCTWLRSQIAIASGALQLSLAAAKVGDRPYACAELQSSKRYGYGTYEVRMRAGRAPGLVSAFFTYTGPTLGTQHDEIDFEVLGKNASSVQLNYFVNAVGGHETFATVPGYSITSYNTYVFQWLPGTMRWYLNGTLVREVTTGPRPTEPGKIMLSLWNGTDQVNGWLGAFAYPGRPITATVDWVAYTKAGESCKFPESILCR